MSSRVYLMVFCIVSLLGVFISSYGVEVCECSVKYLIGDSLAENVEENKYKRFERKSNRVDVIIDTNSIGDNFLQF